MPDKVVRLCQALSSNNPGQEIIVSTFILSQNSLVCNEQDDTSEDEEFLASLLDDYPELTNLIEVVTEEGKQDEE